MWCVIDCVVIPMCDAVVVLDFKSSSRMLLFFRFTTHWLLHWIVELLKYNIRITHVMCCVTCIIIIRSWLTSASHNQTLTLTSLLYTLQYLPTYCVELFTTTYYAQHRHNRSTHHILRINNHVVLLWFGIRRVKSWSEYWWLWRSANGVAAPVRG